MSRRNYLSKVLAILILVTSLSMLGGTKSQFEPPSNIELEILKWQRHNEIILKEYEERIKDYKLVPKD